jgi:hypothetical protein
MKSRVEESNGGKLARIVAFFAKTSGIIRLVVKRNRPSTANCLQQTPQVLAPENTAVSSQRSAPSVAWPGCCRQPARTRLAECPMGPRHCLCRESPGGSVWAQDTVCAERARGGVCGPKHCLCRESPGGCVWAEDTVCAERARGGVCGPKKLFVPREPGCVCGGPRHSLCRDARGVCWAGGGGGGQRHAYSEMARPADPASRRTERDGPRGTRRSPGSLPFASSGWLVCGWVDFSNAFRLRGGHMTLLGASR